MEIRDILKAFNVDDASIELVEKKAAGEEVEVDLKAIANKRIQEANSIYWDSIKAEKKQAFHSEAFNSINSTLNNSMKDYLEEEDLSNKAKDNLQKVIAKLKSMKTTDAKGVEEYKAKLIEAENLAAQIKAEYEEKLIAKDQQFETLEKQKRIYKAYDTALNAYKGWSESLSPNVIRRNLDAIIRENGYILDFDKEGVLRAFNKDKDGLAVDPEKNTRFENLQEMFEYFAVRDGLKKVNSNGGRGVVTQIGGERKSPRLKAMQERLKQG